MPTAKTRKIVKRKSTTTQKKALSPIEKIAAECERRFGWATRLTIYETDERKIDRMRTDKETFTTQHPKLSEQVIIAGYEVREVGGLADPKTRRLKRVVQLTRRSQQEPETEED